MSGPIRTEFPELSASGYIATRGVAKWTGISHGARESHSFAIQFLSFEGLTDYNPRAMRFPSLGLQISATSDVFRKTSILTSEPTRQLCPMVARHLDLA